MQPFDKKFSHNIHHLKCENAKVLKDVHIHVSPIRKKKKKKNHRIKKNLRDYKPCDPQKFEYFTSKCGFPCSLSLSPVYLY